MFSHKRVRDYYNTELWGHSQKTNENMKDLLKHHEMEEKDLRTMGFNEEQIKYFMS